MAALRNRKMGGFLNLVYDNVMVEERFYHDFFSYTVKIGDNYRTTNITEINDDNENYFYIVRSNLLLELQFYNFGGLCLSNRVIDCLKKHKNFYVIFLTPDEADIDSVVTTLDLFISKYNLNSEKFFLMNLNEKLSELKYQSNSKINVHTFNKLKYIFSNEMSSFDPELTENKDYLFCCYNRNLKSHRFIILSYLKKYNILNNTDWSWLRGDRVKEFLFDAEGKLTSWFLKNILSNNQIEFLKEEIDFLLRYGIKQSVFEIGLEIDKPPFNFDWNVAYQNNTYKNSYINIVTESDYEQKNLVLISEKSLIPLYFNQIPIFVANPHHIKKLKEYDNFDFFDDLVNHSYDNELDPEKRMLLIVDEINRLNNKKDEVVEFYKKNKDRFIENRKKILKFTTNKKDIEYFNNLKNFDK